MRVLYGDDVTIPVEVTGSPTPSVTWDTPGGPTTQEEDGSLTIAGVGPEHEGVYTVYVNNTPEGEPQSETVQLVIGTIDIRLYKIKGTNPNNN